ncbi:MAG: hypothetical protein ABIW49_10605 [Knoellia sp.]
MKKFLGILLALVGLVLTAAGIAGVILIGSDDTVDSPATTIELGDAKAVVSTPGLLAFTDTTMRLTAESTGGSVFLGRAHPIDAKSYLATAPTYAVTKVDTSGMSGEVVKGDAKTTLPDPGKQTFWTAKATGAGKQSLALELDGTPTEYVVMPIGKPGDVIVTSGIQIKNGFTLSIGALVLGVLALISGGLLLRRRKNTLATGHEANTTKETVVATDVPAPARTMSRIVGIGVIAAVVPALAGCGMVPTKVDTWKNDAITKPAMTQPEAVAALKGYADRKNAVSKSSAATFNPRGWESVDGGLVLAGDQYDTAYRRLKKDKTVTTGSWTARRVYSPSFGSYPMYALVSGTSSYDEEPGERLVALSRASVTAPWVKVATSPAPVSLPDAVAPGDASTLSARDKKVALAAAGAITAEINTGKGTVTLPKEVEDFLAEWRKREDYLASSRVTAELWNPEAADQLSPAGSIFAAKGAKGQVALVTYRLLTTWVAKSDSYVYYNDKDFAAVIGQSGDRDDLRFQNALTVAVTLDAKGTPTIVGYDLRDII